VVILPYGVIAGILVTLLVRAVLLGGFARGDGGDHGNAGRLRAVLTAVGDARFIFVMSDDPILGASGADGRWVERPARVQCV
jgi:hypothetical protein